MSNHYTSTRGGVGSTTYEQALLGGLAPDGGLYVPERIPQVDEKTLQQLSGKPYTDVFSYINGLFVGSEIDSAAQEEIAHEAFSQENFSDSRDGNITPAVEIQPGVYLQQLSLGPTAAFKDMALQPVSRLMQHFLARQGESLTMLGATSGDTGSAAEAAFKDMSNISLFMLSPEEGMSPFQKAQMGALTGDRIFNISIPARFDDCQELVKGVKSDPEFADLGAVNSINWGRIAAQVAYYFSGYLQVVGDEIGEKVDFVVPTGNFGNVLAGYYAREMGLPIRKLIVATNENDVLHRLIQQGIYERPASAQVTTSPSMDITNASNFERLLFDLVERNPELTRSFMGQFQQSGRAALSLVGLGIDELKQADFDSGRSTHGDRIQAIRDVYRSSDGTIIDPHTADAVSVALRRKENDGVLMVCLATALPVKFEQTIREALDFVPERPSRFAGLERSVGERAFVLLANDQAAVKDYIRRRGLNKI
jgi:threonine synthase